MDEIHEGIDHKNDEPQKHPIVERTRIECTDCGGLIDSDMAIRRDGKPYCGECQDHPIVERPEYLWDPGLSLIFQSEREHIIRYIEHLEHNLERATAAMAEGVKNMQRLETEVQRLTDAIHQKDNALEVCQDRRWEAEEKVGELMEEVDRLKNVR